jgi:hypothetical protein
MSEFLAGDGRNLALASWWMIAEAASALPEEEDLQALAEHAAGLAKPAVDKAVAALREKPDDEALTAVIFAALADRSNAEQRGAALEALGNREPSALVVIAKALLTEPGKIDRAAVQSQLLSPSGDDMLTAMLAIACRRAGNEVWSAFRARTSDILGRHALRGEVVVLVSRLSTAEPYLALARR